MAIISKLRRSGWVLGFILISLVLFVISDFITNYNKYTSGGGRGEVGIIAGNKIKVEEFDQRYKQSIVQYESTGQTADATIKDQINSMVWNQLIQEYIIEKEYDKIGLAVTQEESAVLLYTNDAHQLIKQNFSQNNQFDPTLVKKIIDQNRKNPEAMYQIERIIKQVILETRTKKYTSMIAKSLYATDLDVEDDYVTNTMTAKGKIVTLNYMSIPDKDIKVTDAEMQDYINQHKEDFKQTDSRDIEFAVWYISPTKEDTLATRDELASEISRFAETDNDSLFCVLNNSTYDGAYKNPSVFPKEIAGRVFSAPKDSVIGPVYYAGGFSLFKVKDIKEDTVNYIHAVRCDIPVKGFTQADTAAAMVEAGKIAAQARGVSDAMAFFQEKLRAGEASNPFDMGWFQEGNQSIEINKAIKNLNKGDATVVKSMFGISVVKIVDPKSKKLIKFAEIRKNVEALQATEDVSYTKALNFRNSITSDKDDFEKMAAKANVAKSISKEIKESDKVISGIPETADVVRWIYNEDRKVGDYSDVFSGPTYQMVVRVSGIKKEGTQSLEDAKEKVEKLVRNEKKAVMLKAQFEKVLPTAKSIEDVALGVKSIAQPVEGLTFLAQSVPFAGNDPKVVGYLFGGSVNKLSKPLVSNDGVHVIFLESLSKQAIPTMMETRKLSLYNGNKQRVYENVLASLTKSEEVKDWRFRYY